jgi:hypothetical protein
MSRGTGNWRWTLETALLGPPVTLARESRQAESESDLGSPLQCDCKIYDRDHHRNEMRFRRA